MLLIGGLAVSVLGVTGCPPEGGGGTATTTTTIASVAPCTSGTVTLLSTTYSGDFDMSSDGGWVATNTVLNGTGTFSRVNRLNASTGASLTVGTDTYSSAPVITGDGSRIFWMRSGVPGTTTPNVIRQWDATTGTTSDVASVPIIGVGGSGGTDGREVNVSANGSLLVVSGVTSTPPPAHGASFLIDTTTNVVTPLDDSTHRLIAGRPSADGRYVPIARSPLSIAAPTLSEKDAVLYDRSNDSSTTIATGARVEVMNSDATLVLVSTWSANTLTGYRLWHRSTGTDEALSFPGGSTPVAMSSDGQRFVLRQTAPRYLDPANGIDFVIAGMSGAGIGVSADLRRVVGHVNGNDVELFACD